MKIHFLQHVAFEGLASIEPILLAQGHSINGTHFYMDQSLPDINNFDALIIMGGPMGTQDESQYPWLIAEKAFIQQAINNGKKILGICLGAQLLAEALGAQVSQNHSQEIGWFPLNVTAQGLKPLFPPALEVLHWHGDTFSIPQGATPLGSSEACKNQGFTLENRIIALQFHLESTPLSAQALLRHCANELVKAPYVQSAEQILSLPARFREINIVMQDLLCYWLKSA